MPIDRPARRPRLEPLEPRDLLATFVVTDPGDLDNGKTLRSAILASDATPGPNLIDFNLPVAAAEVITLVGSLPAITTPVVVDGRSQPGPFLQIDAGSSKAAGLVVDATGVTIKGLTVDNMTSYGIEIEGPGSDQVETGYVLGTAAPPGQGAGQPVVGAGVWIDGSPNNTIGGGGLAEDLSANDGVGVLISGATAAHNLIEGANIGSDDGSNALPNTMGGVRIYGAPDNSIGAPTVGGANLISGNGGDGILINGTGADNNLIRTNNIGLNEAFTAALPNAGAGIEIDQAGGTTIGGPVGSQNLISGNTGDGVLIKFSSAVVAGGFGADVWGNVIGTDGTHNLAIGNRNGIELEGDSGVSVWYNDIAGNRANGVEVDGGASDLLGGNKIGLDGADNGPLPNGTASTAATTFAGLALQGASLVQVGGLTTAYQNVISGNDGPGIVVLGGASNTIRGDIVGLDPSGKVRVPNRGDGVLVEAYAVGNVIGGDPTPSAANVISSNDGHGVHVVGPNATGTVISYDKIGLDPTGSVPLGNVGDGIRLDQAAATVVDDAITANGANGITLNGGSGSTVAGDTIGSIAGGGGNQGIGIQLIGSNANTIGGTAGTDRDFIASNANVGVYVSAGSSGNLVEGNFIGLDGSGRGGRGNADGIVVRDSAGTTIGGTAAGAGNVVGSNSSYGIDVSGATSTGTSVVGNIVGLAADGAGPAGNVADGVVIDGAPGVLIERNFLSGNGGAGVQAVGATATGANIRSNLIGLDTTGMLPRGNGRGIVFNQAPGNTVGGPSASARNLIGASRAEGILILGAGASGNQVASNWIGLDATGLGAQGNRGDGILIDAPRNIVGGAGGVGRNLIAASGSVGVHLLSGVATGNLVAGNWVGLDAGGRHAPGSRIIGILVDGAPGNTVGGASVAGSGNVVTGSGSADVDVAGPGASGNLVAGNLIGISPGGAALASAPIGLLIDGAPGNTVGGATATAVNFIGGHSSVGLEIANAGASANVVFGNQIGPGQSGGATLANALGVLISDAPGNTVAGLGSNPPNVIVGNRTNAITVVGPKAVGNVVAPNLIGHDA